jgi:hypothetical protein
MSYRHRLNKIKETLGSRGPLKLVWLEEGDEPPALAPGEESKAITLLWDTSENERGLQPQGGKQE